MNERLTDIHCKIKENPLVNTAQRALDRREDLLDRYVHPDDQAIISIFVLGVTIIGTIDPDKLPSIPKEIFHNVHHRPPLFRAASLITSNILSAQAAHRYSKKFIEERSTYYKVATVMIVDDFKSKINTIRP